MAEANTAVAGTRKRGRPRTMEDDHQPHPAEERRRKQIRVAQQTYRRRKEVMITSLQTRVQKLESSIEELSESFLSFSDLLLGADILEKQPRVASALQKITEQYVSLAKSGCEDHAQAGAASNAPDLKLSVASNFNLDYNPDIAQHGTLPILENMKSSLPTMVQSQLPPTPPFQEQPILPVDIDLLSPTIPISTSGPPLHNALTIKSHATHTKQGWALSHSLVRQCYENGYRLLVDSPDDFTTIQSIFGRQLTTPERNSLISAFYTAIHDEIGDKVKHDANFLSSKINAFASERLEILSSTWQNETRFVSEEWLDANEVQRFLKKKGIIVQDNGFVRSSSPFDFLAKFDVLAFIGLLSLGPICVGCGPAFRMRDVEYALHLATSENAWPFDVGCHFAS
ncbi:bZIP transcription factor bZIP-1 [Penicillium nucicola]|uniref:bZIP transcription factor bZIP-1 n=1 Tax=Penicillium nucicola TaxID=1850975 RepID=UPI002545B02B|nr:bZIP transcription factor bZIP-1 [Penicillium nucicola]KAJ5761829.1 bZIP transcription factor bZIP-1 [Penicillium nucicola]